MARRTTLGLLSISLVGLGTGLLGGACKYRLGNPDHCSNHEGDRYCAASFPSKPVCSSGADAACTAGFPSGCVAEDELLDGCHDLCGVLSDEECAGVGSSTGTTTTTDEPSSSTDSGSSETSTPPTPCLGSEDCTELDAPYCDDEGVCVPCGQAPLPADADAACAAIDSSLPACADGTCVQCTTAAPQACAGKTPVCDDATHTCVPCNAHDQCGEAACNLYTGACLPADTVVHVGPGQDFPTLTAAVLSFSGAGEQGTIIVHDGDYNESTAVASSRTLAFLAADGDLPRWVRNSGNESQLRVTAGATMLMHGIQMSGNASAMVPALEVDGARAWLDNTRVVDNNGGGILADNAAELTLRNCFVGGSVDDAHALEINGATANVLYSTLGSGTFNASALTCTVPIAVDVRNSILVTRGGMPPDEVACPTANIIYSATEGTVTGDGNVAVGTFPGASPADWFVDYATGDFGLQNEGLTLFADIAQWQVGDPPTDIDGDPRPAIDATPDHAGADVP